MGALLFFALVLAVMGGGIAYAGDRLGSYIGKKRHSSFGLRPRHTAMLWTVVSGAGVALLTLLLFLALNHAFGVALVRGPQLLAANARLNHQNEALARQGAEDARRAADLGRQAAQAQAQANAAQTQANAAGTRAARAQASLAVVAARLSSARTTLETARAALLSRQKLLGEAQVRLAQARRGLGTTQAELGQARTQVREARAGVREARRQFQQAGRQVVQANLSVLRLVIRQDRLRTEQDRLAGENSRLVRQNAAQRDLLAASQGRPLVLRREEELGRAVLDPAQPPDTLRRALAVFLARVELTARKRGAGGLDNSPAVLVPAPGFVPAPGSGADGGAAAREAALDALSESIAAQSGTLPSVVVVASARFNTFKGEAAQIDLRPYANLLVFPRGQTVARNVLNGGLPEDEVLKQLEAFLTGPVRTAALQRGMIPLRDPQSGEPQVGEPISSAESLALVRRIREAGPNARITADAARDTYSADLLRLNLRVSPAPPGLAPRPVGTAGK